MEGILDILTSSSAEATLHYSYRFEHINIVLINIWLVENQNNYLQPYFPYKVVF